jgi:hypothetical protein
MEEHAAAAATPAMPFSDKLINIFSSPGALFDNVRLTPTTHSNWLIPMLIVMIVTIGMSQVVMNNASLKDQIVSVSQKKMAEQMDKNVQAGKMTAEQAEQAKEQASNFMPGSTWFSVIQIGGVIIVTPIILMLMGLVYWLLGKTAMKAQAPYIKVVEVVGLTFLIGAIESIVTTLLMFAFDSIHASASLALFVSQFNPEDKLHLVLAKVNLFTFWSLGVTSVGLSRVFQRDFPKVLVLVLALWVLWSIASVALGLSFN